MKGDNKMSTLSERMREFRFDAMDTINLEGTRLRIDGWADEVEALEARLAELESPNELSPKDKLMQGYEKIGMTSAFHKYGKHSSMGYKHQDKRDE